MDDFEREAIAKAKRVRPHASFFEWPIKETKELGVVKELIETVGGPLTFQAVRPGRPDPPDAVGEREDGSLVAIEVTELVDEEVTRRNVQTRRRMEKDGADRVGESKKLVHRVWDRDEFIAAVGSRLIAKDDVGLKGGPYGEYVVTLHTDEMMLTHVEAEGWLRDHTFAGMRQVTGAYLLFSYDGERYPYIRLNVAA